MREDHHVLWLAGTRAVLREHAHGLVTTLVGPKASPRRRWRSFRTRGGGESRDERPLFLALPLNRQLLQGRL